MIVVWQRVKLRTGEEKQSHLGLGTGYYCTNGLYKISDQDTSGRDSNTMFMSLHAFWFEVFT